mmetsp:Transcript_12800/g.31170  ORF Transcript_12800/g.31170 Transcript_12800/m.31170 type:complete len:251 (+) Transcript_12800:1530-2282(+)
MSAFVRKRRCRLLHRVPRASAATHLRQEHHFHHHVRCVRGRQRAFFFRSPEVLLERLLEHRLHCGGVFHAKRAGRAPPLSLGRSNAVRGSTAVRYRFPLRRARKRATVPFVPEEFVESVVHVEEQFFQVFAVLLQHQLRHDGRAELGHLGAPVPVEHCEEGMAVPAVANLLGEVRQTDVGVLHVFAPPLHTASRDLGNVRVVHGNTIQRVLPRHGGGEVRPHDLRYEVEGRRRTAKRCSRASVLCYTSVL